MKTAKELLDYIKSELNASEPNEIEIHNKIEDYVKYKNECITFNNDPRVLRGGGGAGISPFGEGIITFLNDPIGDSESEVG